MKVGTLASVAALFAVVARAGNVQAPYSDSDVDGGLSLQSVTSAESFTTFSHASFPKHSVRIKRTDGFCDMTGVRTYTGYIDIDTRHLFFYFFESRSNPAMDDVIMWINGSTTGLFVELGPCRWAEDGLEHNPFSWNHDMNLFFLDQPVGVGYSYADYGETVVTTEQAAIDVAAFISIFFETFGEFRGRKFHMSGESYAGRYLPIFASEVVDQNILAQAQGRTPINLQSLIIGNGFTDFLLKDLARIEMLCTNATGLPPALSISGCIEKRAKAPRCREWFTAHCIDTFDAISCEAATTFCEGVGAVPGFNIFDLTLGIAKYLNLPDVRARLGATNPGNFTTCSDAVDAAFNAPPQLDMLHSSRAYVEQLLERGVRVLLFAGTLDLSSSWLANLWNAHNMQWTGRTAFNGEKLRPWHFEGTVAGETKKAQGLTFASVYGAGHLVPVKKPAEALHLVRQFVRGEEL
ncbi:serine carboxypeptidase [Auriculariales sp. MPI-PUGE-AT-0066]|nr:serine carboxypeptidase [Auriculariales sp. MPI-PUGE-AT-0066]